MPGDLDGDDEYMSLMSLEKDKNDPICGPFLSSRTVPIQLWRKKYQGVTEKIVDTYEDRDRIDGKDS